ncbi:MAG: DUF998 domain-containing protein [Bauldia sp.]|nr:DUF998 domain-containing protein [Bauldia sp.]
MRTRWLLLVGAAAPIFYALVVVVGGFAYPGYSHFGNTISDMMALAAPHRIPMAIGLALGCLLGPFLGAGLIARLGRFDRRFVLTGWMMILIGFVGASISFFPVDGLPGDRAPAEVIHLALTGLVFAFIAVAVGSFAFAARREAGFGRVARRSRLGARRRAAFEALASWSFVTLGIILASGLATSLAEAYDFEAVGLLERVFVGTYLVWLLVVAVALLRRPAARGGG